MKSKMFPIAVLTCLALAGCGASDSGDTSHSGGSTSSGGQQVSGGGGGTAATGTGTGGAVATGGIEATGGTATGGAGAPGGVGATGGLAGGGDSTTGGRTGGGDTGGAAPTGGTSATGGRTGGGGRSAGGGDSGGAASTGGTSAGGAATSGGSTGTGGGGSGDAVKSPGCGTETTAKSGNNQTISVGGTSRTYNLKIPDPYDMNHPYRLIVSYHWMNGTAANVSDGSGTAKAYYGLWDLAGGSTIFVAPQGTGNRWSNSGGVDVEFSRALIEQLESQLCIDTSRIFCEGFSMGGSMSYAMASAMPDVIRGVAVHSGGNMSGTTAGHNKPVAYFMTHGTQDTVCTYPGFGVPQLQDFAKVNGCTQPDPSLSASAFEAALPEPTSTASACVDFTGCQAGYPVRACLFVGPHTPSPDGTNGWVPQETWKFISQF